MARTAQAHSTQAGNFPSVYELERPWKTETLLKLHPEELKAWLDNMSQGMRPRENNLYLEYKLGGKAYGYAIPIKKLYLPDGGFQVIPPSPDPKVGPQNPLGALRDEIVERLQSKLAEPDIISLDIGLTPRQAIESLVDYQMKVLSEVGVERHGSFENTLGRIRHRSYDSTSRIVTNLNHIGVTADKTLAPVILGEIWLNEKPLREVFCEYHTHQGKGNLTPSQGDVMLMIQHGDHSIIIGAQRQPGVFEVSEWKVRRGVDVRAQMKSASGPERGFSGWVQGKEMKELADKIFQRQDYVLREDGGKVVFEKKTG